MSWGYWGILAGLIALLAVFFICMELLYASARGTAKGNGVGADQNRGGSRTTVPDAKHAA